MKTAREFMYYYLNISSNGTVGAIDSAKIEQMMEKYAAQYRSLPIEHEQELIDAIDSLIAVLHGDGGHYREKHGRLKAIKDSQELIYKKWFTKDHFENSYTEGWNDAIKHTDAIKSLESSPIEQPQCPKCGYTKEDQLIHGDHHLCDGEIPEQPEDNETKSANWRHNLRGTVEQPEAQKEGYRISKFPDPAKIKAQQEPKLFVEYANFWYEVADFSNEFGVQWVHIYDEPPSKHIDRVQLANTTGITFKPL